MKPSRMMALIRVCADYNGARLRKRLTHGEWTALSQFIVERAGFGYLEFEHAVNRWYLNDQRKPKHWIEMHELAMAANTRAYSPGDGV